MPRQQRKIEANGYTQCDNGEHSFDGGEVEVEDGVVNLYAYCTGCMLELSTELPISQCTFTGGERDPNDDDADDADIEEEDEEDYEND